MRTTVTKLTTPKLKGKYIRHVAFNDSGDMAKSLEANHFQSEASYIRKGDENLAHGSDAVLARLEKLIMNLDLKTWVTVHDMTGGVPDVPAFLSGEPLNMLRRKRNIAQGTPMTIFVDVSGSSGCSGQEMATRGAVLLALVRILSVVRPVQCYSGFFGSSSPTISENDTGCLVTTPISCNPLDLAHAATLLAYEGAFGIAIHAGKGHHKFMSGWAYGSPNAERSNGQAIFEEVFQTKPVLYVPAIHSRDKETVSTVNEPEKWLIKMLNTYGVRGFGEEH